MIANKINKVQRLADALQDIGRDAAAGFLLTKLDWAKEENDEGMLDKGIREAETILREVNRMSTRGEN